MKKIFYTMAVAAALFAGYSAYNTTENRNLNGTIIEAGTSGIISFDGKVVCGRDGRLTCEPIECKTLYTIILDNSKK